MTSHSIRRGSAAYANASPKLAVQWISTRGAWLLESLTKAFAYIGTTTKEDQSVGKVLAGYTSPDLPVVTPSIRDLERCLSTQEFGQLVTLRDELYRHVRGFQDPRFNVSLDVVDTSLASLLMHLEDVLKATGNAGRGGVASRYEYELDRAIAATNSRLGSSISTRTCCQWGQQLKRRWLAVNHAQVSNVVAGGETLLTSTLESMLGQLLSISERLTRLEATRTQILARLDVPVPPSAAQSAVIVPIAPPIATATTLAGCFLNWYTNHIWENVKGKREQNQRADAKAAVNIMAVLYQTPFQVHLEPRHTDKTAYEH